MAVDNLAEQLTKIKATLVKWYKELKDYTTWAIANDGVLDDTEKSEIKRRMNDINSVLQRIDLIEQKKGINKYAAQAGVATDHKEEVHSDGAAAKAIPVHLINEIDEIKRGLEEIKALMEQY